MRRMLRLVRIIPQYVGGYLRFLDVEWDQDDQMKRTFRQGSALGWTPEGVRLFVDHYNRGIGKGMPSRWAQIRVDMEILTKGGYRP